MAPQTPIGRTILSVPTLGDVEGWLYADGTRQFCGIPYGRLLKRWTRSTLATSWTDNRHNGTRLGPSAPNPPEYNTPGADLLTPVPAITHFNIPIEDELNCLVMNITIPPCQAKGISHPVMCYIHGGSFLYGGANRAIFDGVNLVSSASSRGTPIVAINFNYRVGLGGFLASEAIRQDLEQDGYSGVGNFGLTDQQLALQWIQTYIEAFSGDRDNVTIYGESAGGMSVAHQLAARTPAVFHRAISMSGTLTTIPTWSLSRHEKRFRALLAYLQIDDKASDVLERLRAVPEEKVAAATLPIEGVFVCTGNPCDDGVFHDQSPRISSTPSWLRSFMIGDVYHEGMIFSTTLEDYDYAGIHARLAFYVGEGAARTILALYNIQETTSATEVRLKWQEVAGDVLFRMPNRLTLQYCRTDQRYGYHFDQRSHLDNIFKGLSYHALDLLYVFPNLRDTMSKGQIELSDMIVGHWIDFAYGKDPWERHGSSQKWMVYGPEDRAALLLEEEDESVRKYSRVDQILQMGCFEALVAAVDDICVKRGALGACSKADALPCANDDA